MEITELDAVHISRAFAKLNQRMAQELQKVLESDAPTLLKEAATEQYNNDVENMSKIHIRMATAFPTLGVAAGASAAS